MVLSRQNYRDIFEYLFAADGEGEHFHIMVLALYWHPLKLAAGAQVADRARRCPVAIPGGLKDLIMKIRFIPPVVYVLMFPAFGCTDVQPITEAEVIRAINGFFSAWDVEGFDRSRVSDLVADDFHIYEMEKDFTLEQFFQYVDSQPAPISTDWELSNYTVSTDENSAHVHYSNRGTFVMKDQGNENTVTIEWLESAYFVREDGELKLKFLQSDDITSE